MELNITRFFNECAPADYSASVAELGNNAGRITWGHACEDSQGFYMLDTEDKREAFREHVKGFGAWSDEEISAWSDVELNALLIQMISGDMRDAGLDADNADWEAYEEGANAGTYSGRIFRGDDGCIYYAIGD